MRILMPYETVFPHAFGGLETRNHQLATALCARGHAVTQADYLLTRDAGYYRRYYPRLSLRTPARS